MEKDQIIDKIEQVIAASGKLNSDQFTSILEGIVKKSGKEGEMAIVKFITEMNLAADIRINIMQTAGQIQNPIFLVPLKKVLDTEPNIHIKKAAALAIGKFNNQKALNILMNGLATIANPFLKTTITEQIDNIKKNNPILALLPRFLKGDKDKKGFMVVMDLLKKNVTTADAPVFSGYLASEDASIQRGAFEILCTVGDRTIQNGIFEFFFSKAEEFDPTEISDIENIQSLCVNIKEYFLRFPSMIFPQLGKLKVLYPKIKNLKTKRVLISIICHCRAPEAVAFIKDIYEESDSDLRDYIVEEASGNEQAIDFLFEKYKSGLVLKERVVKALLKNSKGFQYFAEHFESFDPQSQEIIVKSLPDTLQPQIVEFIKAIFKSDLPHLKRFLLSNIRINYHFSFKEVLFDPERQQEFFALDEDYLSTISQLFPIRTAQELLSKVTVETLDGQRFKDYVYRITDIIDHEIALNIRDSNLLSLLTTKIVGFSKSELNKSFLSILEKIKTFDHSTYRYLYDALSYYVDQRGDRMIEDEIHSIKRIKDNFKTIVEDLRKIEELEKELKRAFSKALPDFNQMRKTLDFYHLGVPFKLKWLTRFITEQFKKTDEKYIASWREFFKDFPIITQLIREGSSDGSTQTIDAVHDRLRIVLKLQEKSLIALLKEQVQEVLPFFKVLINEQQLETTDILICDTGNLKELMTARVTIPKRVYLLLENRADFQYFKALNPRAFFQPFSMYRIIRHILHELYIIRSI